MTGPWLVGLDVDGTILLQDETMSPGVPEAIARLRDGGHVVTIATGRSWMATRRYVEELGLIADYVVCSNGAVTMRRSAPGSGGAKRATAIAGLTLAQGLLGIVTRQDHFMRCFARPPAPRQIRRMGLPGIDHGFDLGIGNPPLVMHGGGQDGTIGRHRRRHRSHRTRLDQG